MPYARIPPIQVNKMATFRKRGKSIWAEVLKIGQTRLPIDEIEMMMSHTNLNKFHVNFLLMKKNKMWMC